MCLCECVCVCVCVYVIGEGGAVAHGLASGVSRNTPDSASFSRLATPNTVSTVLFATRTDSSSWIRNAESSPCEFCYAIITYVIVQMATRQVTHHTPTMTATQPHVDSPLWSE
jgi:hypothetical protein